jgi:hypothetical protein
MPESGQRDAKLARAATTLAFVCLAVLGTTTLVLVLPSVRSWLRADASAAGYRPGDRIELAASTYQGAPRTLFIFSRFSCGACQSSKPVIASLISDLTEHSQVRTVLVTPDAVPEEEDRFAREVGADARRLIRTDLTKLNLRMVPTAVLADSEGRVLKVHEGILTEEARTEILAMGREAASR